MAFCLRHLSILADTSLCSRHQSIVGQVRIPWTCCGKELDPSRGSLWVCIIYGFWLTCRYAAAFRYPWAKFDSPKKKQFSHHRWIRDRLRTPWLLRERIWTFTCVFKSRSATNRESRIEFEPLDFAEGKNYDHYVCAQKLFRKQEKIRDRVQSPLDTVNKRIWT